MLRPLSLALAAGLTTLAFAQTGLAQTIGSSSSAIVLHRRFGSCELVQKGMLLAGDQYASVRLDGVSEPIYSPELGDGDFIGFRVDMQQDLAKLARKSGFRMTQMPLASYRTCYGWPGPPVVLVSKKLFNRPSEIALNVDSDFSLSCSKQARAESVRPLRWRRHNRRQRSRVQALLCNQLRQRRKLKLNFKGQQFCRAWLQSTETSNR
jgi:hypothetical protein